MASTNLGKVPSSAGSTTTGTFSFWIKGNLATGSNQNLYSVSDGGNTYQMWINVNGQLDFHAFNGANYTARLHPSANLRDTNGWYHIVFTIDTNNATAGDRLRLYINGERYTGGWTAETYPSQGAGIIFAKNSTTRIGSEWDNTDYFGGLMSHFHMIDGTAYDASAFGEYDANGVWKPILEPSVTYGTNGFFIFENGTNLSGSTVQDQSGNSNNWPVIGGTLTKTEDSPSNVFATLSPLAQSNGTLSNGNTTWSPSGNNASVWSSIAVNTGKWYFEMKKTSGDAFLSFSQTPKFNGFQTDNDTVSISLYMYYTAGGSGTNRFQYNGSSTAFPSGFGNDDNGTIYGVTLDFDADQIIVRRNNDDSTKATFSIPAALKAEPLHVGYSVATTWPSGSFDFNFGNGYFGTTAVSSAGTNASGIGIFEYDVPTGFTALSTKGLNL